ncbi:HD domain-containing protein [Candidatus Woesearchaeota archaeon]|nr:HD domain-containing protein [Candidatus Woesearchaeota archaeon]
MKAYMPNHEYHNQRHAKDVFYTANKLAKMEGMSYEDRFALATAALLHDVVFVKGAKDNEEKSAEFAKPYLVKLGYTSGQIEKISELILATKIPTSPRNKLEMIICDADVDNLGREDFLKRGEEVRQELGIADKKKWYDIQVKFLQSHKYYTTTAQKLRNTGVRNNIETITCSDYA